MTHLPDSPSRSLGGQAERQTGGRAARREAERQRRRRLLRVAIIILTVLVTVVAAQSTWRRVSGGAGNGATVTEGPTAPVQKTLLLIRQPQDGGAAKGITLLVAGPGEGRGSVVFLPVGALVDIPGVGRDRLGAAHGYGGAPLVQAAVGNAFGIAIDHSAVVSDVGLAALLSRVGPVEVDVPERLVSRADAAEPSLRFVQGTQHLDGPRLVEYLSFRQGNEDELETFVRQERVWSALFAAFSADGGADKLDALVAGGAPQLDTQATQSWLRTLFAGIAAAHDAGVLRQALLPVEAFGGEGPDGGATYRVRDEDARALLADLLAAPAALDGDTLRIEVLNGVGVPGVGQAIHARLSSNFRIVRTDNARSFDFTETQILVYEEKSLPAARHLRDLLGVGTISVSRRPQTVVDITVVVGADFTDREGRDS